MFGSILNHCCLARKPARKQREPERDSDTAQLEDSQPSTPQEESHGEGDASPHAARLSQRLIERQKRIEAAPQVVDY